VTDQPDGEPVKESWSMVMPILVLIIIVLVLGIYIPPFLDRVLQKAAGLLGG
jgi:formate hydrogenlyase subunit 3/multisubunit Na+/H+ antiporter MnhD subunit